MLKILCAGHLGLPPVILVQKASQPEIVKNY